MRFRNNASMKRVFSYEREITKDEWLEKARIEARRLIRTYGYVTSDMVKKVYPLPEYLPPSLIGNVFLDGYFKRQRMTRGHENKGGGRMIWRWQIKDS